LSDRSGIEWTSATWNPTTGCDQVSEGCDHCYALTLAKRLKAMSNPRYRRDGDPRTSGPGFGLTLHPDKLDEPLRWRRPRLVFVDSMSDLFHKAVPAEFIARVFAVMGLAERHTFQVLTKRPGRMASLMRSTEFQDLWFRARHDRASADDVQRMADRGEVGLEVRWPLPNVWLGTSVETQRWADVRITQLLRSPAAVRFLSCEPLLGPIDLRDYVQLTPRNAWHGEWTPAYRDWGYSEDSGGFVLRGRPADPYDPQPGIHWIIVGGESGPGARPMDAEWARQLRDQAGAAEVAFFFKQWGGRTPKAGGRELDGRTWDEMPATAAAGGEAARIPAAVAGPPPRTPSRSSGP
jgi:protein gp37